MKNSIKHILRWLSVIIIIPFLFAFKISSFVFDKKKLFPSYSQFFSLIPGKSGCYIRSAFYRFVMERCSEDCTISFGTIFSQIDTELGSDIYIGPQCNIGMCRIDKNCLIGSGVHILSGKMQHNFSDINVPIRNQGGSLNKIKIGEDTWIGNGSIIMANVGVKCIVAAGSVVVNDVNDYSIVAGNPAKVIKSRGLTLQNKDISRNNK